MNLAQNVILLVAFASIAWLWYRWGKQDGIAQERRAQDALRDVMKHCGLVALLALFFTSNASACSRCGFRNPCAFAVQQHHAAIAVAPIAAVAVAQQPQVVTIQNNYPAPNGGNQGLPYGAPQTAPQGSTVFGYQPYSLGQAALPLMSNPDQTIFSLTTMVQSLTPALTAAINGANQAGALSIQLHDRQIAPLIAAQAAERVMFAAGINSALQAQQQATTQSITLTPNGQGGFSIQQNTPQAQQLGYRLTANLSGQQVPNPIVTPPNPAGGSLLSQKCSKCHGTFNPKAGVFVDGTKAMDCKSVARSRMQIKSGKMPQDETITPAERQQLLDELDQLLTLTE